MSLVLAGDVADARIQVMAGNVECSSDRRASRLRAIAWGTAAIMLLLPVFAMQVTDEVDWDAADFVVFGAMLVAAGGAYELAVRVTSNKAYRAAFAVALMAAFILVWLNQSYMDYKGQLVSKDNLCVLNAVVMYARSPDRCAKTKLFLFKRDAVFWLNHGHTFLSNMGAILHVQ